MSKSWGEIRDEALRRCGQLPPKTNADRIRAMSDEELAAWLHDVPPKWYAKKEAWLDWLKQEANLNEGSDNLNA